MEKRLTISKVLQVESLSQIWLSVSEASLSYNEQGLWGGQYEEISGRCLYLTLKKQDIKEM